jgi:hypothetical protein
MTMIRNMLAAILMPLAIGCGIGTSEPTSESPADPPANERARTATEDDEERSALVEPDTDRLEPRAIGIRMSIIAN